MLEEERDCAAVIMTAASFQDVLKDNDIVLVDFWASPCGPCRMFAPVFEKAAGAHPDIVFGKVGTEAERELASVAGIRSIPTLMAFREDVLVFSQPAHLSAAALGEVITAVHDLAMAEVLARVATQTRCRSAHRSGTSRSLPAGVS